FGGIQALADARLGQGASFILGFEQQPVLAAVFFLQLRELADEAFQLGLRCLQRGLFGGEVAGDDQGFGQQVADPALVLGFALLVGFDDAPGLGNPAVGGDQVGVVLHGLGPVVHQVLVDVVGIEQRRGME